MKEKQVSNEKYRRAAIDFANLKEENDKINTRFNSIKESFYEVIGEYLDSVRKKTIEFEDDSLEARRKISVKKVAKTNIIWNADKLEKKLEKSVANQVIRKCYTIQDMKGLTRYLRSCGVDQEVFKKYVLVDKSVDEKVLDRLSDVGVITTEQVKGCYNVSLSKPYYVVSIKRDET